MSGFMYYFKKYIVLNCGMALGSVLTCFYGLFHSEKENNVFTHWVSSYVNYWLGIEWDVFVEEPLDSNQGHVIVANHQAAVDVLGLLRVWLEFKNNTAVLVKKSLLYTGPFGMGLYLCGHYFINRGKSGAKSSVNEAAKHAKKTGTNISAFVEGSRNTKRDLSMLPFKKGPFHMAIDNGMPIVPVVFEQYNFFNDETKTIKRPGKVKAHVLKPIKVEGVYTKENMDELIELTRNRMLDTLKAISCSSDDKKSS